MDAVAAVISDDVLRDSGRCPVTMDTLSGNRKTGEDRAAVFLKVEAYAITRSGGDNRRLYDIRVIRIFAGECHGLVLAGDPHYYCGV